MAIEEGNEARSRTPATLSTVLWPLVMAGYGVYEITRPGYRSQFTFIWDWVLIVFGGLFALLALIVRGLGSPQQAGEKIDALNRNVYCGVHEREIVDESKIRELGLDENFYRQSTEAMQALGFRKLNDVVNLTLQKVTPWARAVVRTFLNTDGSAMGAVYDVKASGLVRGLQFMGVIPRKLRGVEFETELSDGSFVTTSDATQATKASEFTGVSRRFVPQGTAPAEILATHQQHVRSALLARPDAMMIAIRSFEELMASQDRLQVIKSQHRSSAAYNPAEQIARIAGKPLTAEQEEMSRHAAELHQRRVSGEHESDL